MKERIQKVLANFGVDSRRNIEQMLLQGRITVNGRVVTKLPVLIDPEEDQVTVDDEPIKLATSRRGKSPVSKIYYLLNKPRGVYSTNLAQGEQRLAKDLLPPDLPGRVYPVGRLDADSKGLLLMTNDGELTNLLTHPRYEVPKTYRALIDGALQEDTIKTLQEGIWLADKDGKGFKTGRSRVKIIHRSRTHCILEITIKEGRNRQVRRMLSHLGYKVRDLMRIKMGPLTLQGVGIGKARPLTPKEIKQLYALAKTNVARVDGEKSGTSSKPPKTYRPPVEQADAQEDLAVEFEDDELIREVKAEGGVVPPEMEESGPVELDEEVEIFDADDEELADVTFGEGDPEEDLPE